MIQVKTPHHTDKPDVDVTVTVLWEPFCDIVGISERRKTIPLLRRCP